MVGHNHESSRDGSKKTELHCNPDFYGVYLLQSEQKPLSFYVGSTPDPVRRLRQHNGDLKNGGAFKTKRVGFRPWRMIAIIHSFPSKVTALQFEHLLQHPYQTRHIKPHERICNKRSNRSLAHKLGNIRLLLISNYFRHMNLKLHLLEEKANEIWHVNKFGIDILDSTIVTFASFEDTFGNCSTEKRKGNNNMLIKSTFEKDYFERVKDILLFKNQQCLICSEHFQVDQNDLKLSSRLELRDFLNSEGFPLVCACYHCYSLFHLTCLGKHILNKSDVKLIIPTSGDCFSCGKQVVWTTLSKMSTNLRYYFLKDHIKDYNSS